MIFAEDSLRFTQPEIPLWTAEELGDPTGAPEKWNPSTDGFHRITNVHKPSMFVFLPPKEKATGAGVVICPGGGHSYLVMDLEGSLVAEKLNTMGIAAFVLKSRLARAEGSLTRRTFTLCRTLSGRSDHSKSRRRMEHQYRPRRDHGIFGRRTDRRSG